MKKGFTLTEIIIAIIILGTLATISFPIYQNTVESAQAKVCETNLKVIHGAIEIYGLERDRMPGSLSELSPEHLRRAWAKVFEKEDQWRIKFAYFIVDLQKKGLSYAQESFLQRYLGGEIKLITCPKDDTPPPAGVSYGLFEGVVNLSYREYKALSPNIVVVGDCDNVTFGSLEELDHRHSHWTIMGKEKFSLHINRGKKLGKGKGLGLGLGPPGQGLGPPGQGLGLGPPGQGLDEDKDKDKE